MSRPSKFVSVAAGVAQEQAIHRPQSLIDEDSNLAHWMVIGNEVCQRRCREQGLLDDARSAKRFAPKDQTRYRKLASLDVRQDGR